MKISDGGSRCGSSRRNAPLCCLVLLFVCCVLVEEAAGQAYHFSKGWMPGRKRGGAAVYGLTGEGPPPAVRSGETADDARLQSCHARQQVLRGILDNIKVIRATFI